MCRRSARGGRERERISHAVRPGAEQPASACLVHLTDFLAVRRVCESQLSLRLPDPTRLSCTRRRRPPPSSFVLSCLPRRKVGSLLAGGRARFKAVASSARLHHHRTAPPLPPHTHTPTHPRQKDRRTALLYHIAASDNAVHRTTAGAPSGSKPRQCSAGAMAPAHKSFTHVW